MHIAANAAMSGAVRDEDRAYLANFVANKTGVSTDEAQKRVDTFIQTVKDVSGAGGGGLGLAVHSMQKVPF
jgi:mevalonate kinase